MAELKSLNFGNVWTAKKLNAVEDYIKAYHNAMKNQPFSLCYIDAFAGNGDVTLKDGTNIMGSALRALKYGFQKYYFFEQNQKNAEILMEKIQEQFPEKVDKVKIVVDDCNKTLQTIDDFGWQKNNWRGIAFLDPYAMDLEWKCLEAISGTKVFDVWYFFPIMAVTRNLYRNADEIPTANRNKLTSILGSNDWEIMLYKESNQISFFGQESEKTNTNGLKDYLLWRLKQTFPAVAKEAAIMRNERNSGVFMLCFAMSNKSKKA
jgi:three-Cys-motif partner protein